MTTYDDAPDDDEDEGTTPVRVTEATVAAYQWDAWQQERAAAVRRGARFAWAVTTVAAGVAAAAGLVLIPGTGKISVAVYGPVVAWGIWRWTRDRVVSRALRGPLGGVRDLVVPALVDSIGGDELRTLLTNGGTLVTNLSTTIVAERRDSLVALVASEYDLSKSPNWHIPNVGFAGP